MFSRVVLIATLVFSLTSPSEAAEWRRNGKKKKRNGTTTSAPAEGGCGFQLQRRHFLWAAAVAVPVLGVGWLVYEDGKPTVVLLGDADAARTKQLQAQAQRHELLLLLERGAPTTAPEQEKTSTYAVDHPLAAAAENLWRFRSLLFRLMFVHNGMRLPANQSQTGLAARVVDALGALLASPELESVVGPTRMGTTGMQASPALGAVGLEAADAVPFYERILATVQTQSFRDAFATIPRGELERDEINARAKLPAVVKALFEELMSDAGIIALVAASDIFQTQLAAKLRAGINDPIAQVPPAVIDLVQNAPGFNDSDRFRRPPYDAETLELLSAWRNETAARRLRALLEQTRGRKVSIALVMGADRAKALEAVLKKELPSGAARISVTP